VDARREIEFLTHTLGLDRLSLSASETIRRGTLVVRPSREPGASGSRRIRGEDHASLPRLDTSAPGGEAELVLGDLLGAGGMGAVYRARQRSLRRDVAVKRLKDGPDATQGVPGLLAEARTTGALEHPSIVPVHQLGVDEDGNPLLVMKRIEGASLEDLMRVPDHPSWAELERRHGDRLAALCVILERVADALHFAHARGTFHRDVKPANVMVGRFGEVYLLDWGVALHRTPDGTPAVDELGDTLQSGERDAHEIVGTPAYMAPEMVRADPALVDARTDVYLLGATLHTLLTGKARHEGEHLAKIMFSCLESEPVAYDASVPAGLGELANQATSADPAARPESARAFGDRLAEHLRRRGAMRLGEAAEQKLAALVAEGEPSPARLAEPEISGALHECRFALEQSLREWDGNTAARAALDRTLRLMIEGEIARRSPEGAATLARALAPSDPEIERRIAALREEVREARRLEEEARAEQRERDLAPTSRFRVPYIAVVLVLSLLLFVWAVVDESRQAAPLPMTRIVPYDVAMLGVMSAGLWIFRKRALRNRIARQLASLLLLGLATSTFVDQIHASRGETSMQAGPLSIATIGAVYVGAAIGIGGRLWVAAAVCYVAAAVAALWPATSTAAVGGGILACLITLAYDGLGLGRAKEPPSTRQDGP
jgi:serine/threonine-protein kinase